MREKLGCEFKNFVWDSNDEGRMLEYNKCLCSRDGKEQDGDGGSEVVSERTGCEDVEKGER